MRFLYHDARLDRADRVQLYASYALRLLLLAEAALALVQGSFLTAFLSVGILLLTLVPAFVRHSYRVYLPVEFDLLTVLFVFASLFLGEVRSYYERFWWWDALLHTWAGLLTGLLGFVLVYVLNREQRAGLTLSPFFVGLFSFAFSMAIGAVWEIFEFAMDGLFGLNMQKSGLVDTMWDLIVNMAGALVVSTAGAFYVRGGDSMLFDRLVRRLLEQGPRPSRRPSPRR